MKDAITSEQRQYHIEEYKTLKNELAEAFKEGFQIVVFSVTANAAVFTFISGHPEVAKGGLFYLVSSLPLFITLISYALFLLRRRSITRITRYLYEIETIFAADKLGWERYYARDIANRPPFFRTPVVLNTLMLIQLVYAVIFAIVSFTGRV
jgi:hypothetical protein